MSKLEALLEAERRGILPADRVSALSEARRRGLIAPLDQPVAQEAPEAPRTYSAGEVQERDRLQGELADYNNRAPFEDFKMAAINAGEKYIARPLLQATTAAADGVTAIPRLAANIVPEISNRFFGTDIPKVAPLTSGSLEPKNIAERLLTGVSSGVAGAAAGVGVGQLLTNMGGQATRNVGQALAANPYLQAASGVTGPISGELAVEAGAGPVGQLAASLAGSLVPSVASSAAAKAATGLNRTAEAQRLLDAGVDLTPGQLNPRGRINQIEEGTQSVGLVGSGITAGRENARSTFQRAAIERGAAPGTTIQQADPAAMLDDAYKSYAPLYDEAKGFGAAPVILNTNGPNVSLTAAVKRAIRTPSILATKDQRGSVLAFVEDQLTKGVRSSDDLLNIRSSIRDKARSARRSTGKEEQAELLDAADDVITRALESQLSGSSAGNKALQALRTADASYGNYKIVESAVARSKDRPGGFTPNDLSEAVAGGGRGAEQGGYARGAGGPLRELAADARATLDARSPPTGARLLALAPGAAVATIDPITGLAVQGATTAAIVTGAATKTGRRLAAGMTDWQRALNRQISAANIDVPLSYKQALARFVTQSTSDQLAKVTPARELVFLDPNSNPEQVAIAKQSIAKTDPAAYRLMVRQFLNESYSNPAGVGQDPRRIRAVLPSGAADALTEVFGAAQGLNNVRAKSVGPLSDTIRQRSLGSLQFLIEPGKADPDSASAGLDALTDALLDPEKRFKLRQAAGQKDSEKKILLLGAIFSSQSAASKVQDLSENVNPGEAAKL